MRYIYLTLVPLLLASCAMAYRDDPEIYRVGELEVRLYQDREKMARDLPEPLKLIEATRVVDKQIKIFGYYDRKNKRIYSIDDARVLIHEFRHHLEPHWRHGTEPSHPDGAQELTKQDSGERENSPFQDSLFNPPSDAALSQEPEAVEVSNGR